MLGSRRRVEKSSGALRDRSRSCSNGGQTVSKMNKQVASSRCRCNPKKRGPFRIAGLGDLFSSPKSANFALPPPSPSAPFFLPQTHPKTISCKPIVWLLSTFRQHCSSIPSIFLGSTVLLFALLQGYSVLIFFRRTLIDFPSALPVALPGSPGS